MNQSTIIFGYLFLAFLLFITQRGALPIYLGFVLATPKTPAAGPTATGSGALKTSDASNAMPSLETVAKVLPFVL